MDPIVPKDIPLPLPAPFWLLVVLLWVSFILHIFFVNLVVGGSLFVLVTEIIGLRKRGWDRISQAIAQTITVNKSMAVVLGVAPLLTISVLYTVQFYAANTLTGHAWMMVIPLVILAFLFSYAHKYSWDRLGDNKALHIGLALVANLLFLSIPLIFLTNINLMLYPEAWGSVTSFFDALFLANVLPRYLHFVSASLALTGLFLVLYLGNEKRYRTLAVEGVTRETAVRRCYEVTLAATVAQFAIGLLVFLTLPAHVISGSLVGLLVIVLGLAAFAVRLLWLEIRDEKPGRRLWPVVTTLALTVGFMAWARHDVRETAITPHRQLVEQKTRLYQAEVLKAQNYMVMPGGLGGGTLSPGAKIFSQRCASCHSFDKKLVGPPLREVISLYAANPGALMQWIAKPGRKRPDFPTMPPQELSRDELEQVAKFVLEQ